MTDSIQLNNQSQKYPELTWTKNEYHQLQLAVNALKAIRWREDNRHEMDAHLTQETYNALDEAISILSDELDYDPTPNEPCEPPMTAAEMHSTAWEQHQEMRR
jgi:hypothetical protein